MKRYLLFFIVLLVSTKALLAQQPDIVFSHITEKEGLSYNLVNGFLKDSRGLLWISTYNGLNKYDGSHFYTYHSDHSKNSLPSNSVHKLAEDKEGNIWGGTDRGVFCLNPVTGQFKNYGTPFEEKWPAVYNVCCDKEGRIWVTNDFCLSVFNNKIGRFELPPSEKNYYPKGMIRKNGLAESPDGKGFWLATKTGLQYYSKTEKKFLTSENSISNDLFNGHDVAALCKTSFGHYWYFDNKEKKIIGFDPVSKVRIYQIKMEESNRVADGATLFEDSKHILWFGNWRYEIYMIDYRNGKKPVHIKHNKEDPTSIAGDFFWEATEQNDGTLWFGTVAGISKFNPSRLIYKVHHLPAAANTAENPAIEFITENPLDKTWWMATTKKMLVHYYPVSGKSELINLSTISRNRSNNHPVGINKMLFLKDSILLFSNTGVWIKKGNSNFLPLELPSPFQHWVITDAVVDKSRFLYGITHHKMLKWDLQTNKIDSIVFKEPFMVDGSPVYLAQPHISNDKVWIQGSRDWLIQAEGKELKAIYLNYRDSSLKEDGYFTSKIADSKGNLWMTKKGAGLVSYNPSTNSSKLLKQADGLAMDHVMAVAEDGYGKIWSGCYYQFSVYNPDLNSFYNFSLPLSPNNYSYVNFLAALSNGNIIGNVAGDIVEFFADRLKTPQVNDKPLISQFLVNERSTDFYDKEIIKLSPGQNSLRIKFGMLTDISSIPYSMEFILEGADKKASIADMNFEANYNSLAPGDYIFKVKAVAKDKSWQTKESVLKIHINSPFYKKSWFWVLISICIITALIFFYRFRINKQKQIFDLESKAQQLEKEKAMVMYEGLKQQLNPHFLFNSLTSLSGLIETNQNQAGEFLEQMSGIYRYILKNGNSETVLLDDELAFAQLYINLQKTRFKKGFQVTIDVPEEYRYFKIAPVTLQNLIENAIKHNIIDPASPLHIQINIDGEYIVVKNNLQRKFSVETSNKKGLAQFKTLYSYLTVNPVIVREDENFFYVKVPLI